MSRAVRVVCALLVVTLGLWSVGGLAVPALALVESGGGGNAWTRVVAAVTYARPVPGHVVRAFDSDLERFSAGHRGVDLYAPPGTPVAAAGDGLVTFAGPVAGVAWVTLRHDDGVRTSYGHLDAVWVTAGQLVARGQPVGRAAGDLSGGQPHVHWGARRDDYFDPMLLLPRSVVRVRLDGPGQAGIEVAR